MQIEADGPTTKADCLNHIYDALVAYERTTARCATAVVLHDPEDVVHPLELKLFDRLIDRAAVIQLPILPLVDGSSRWVSGHYYDEFAEAHIKELVVREPLAPRSRSRASAARLPGPRSPGLLPDRKASRSRAPA